MTRTHNINRLEMPFCSVVGQDQFKLALILVAINPAIGGVVISGPRGSAKSTLARGLAALLPPDKPSQAKTSFVTLPLGASEDMLIGTLNLEKVLNEKQLDFSPGLLSKAHGGVLYVDEVNLLPDNLVDLLLDVASSGINYIERDGISHQHKAEFVLVGTMNPDEGELRSQLHDRFGLAVDLNNRYELSERVAIVKARESFDANPEVFIRKHDTQQKKLVAKITDARHMLSRITCADSLRIEIAKRCEDAKVDGLRADIVWHRAALAHAAWEGRVDVLHKDIDAVSELVLHHRRREGDSSPPPRHNTENNDPSSDRDTPPGGFKRPDDSHRKASQSSESGAIEGDWGNMEPTKMEGIMRPQNAIPIASKQRHVSTQSVYLDAMLSQRKGKASLGRKTSAISGRLPDWFGTLLNGLGDWPPKKLKMHKRKMGQAALHVILFDTSGSTLHADVFPSAKGVVAAIAKEAYLHREQLAIFGFGNNQVEGLMAKVRAPKELEGWLSQLKAGGGTPMRQGLSQILHYCRMTDKRNPGINIRTYIVSDGRSREAIEPMDFPGECVWIDTEQAVTPRGRGKQFAQQLGALYISLKSGITPSTQPLGGRA